MGKYKTSYASAGDGRVHTSVGKLRVLSKNDDFFYDVELWLLNGLTNRNNWRYERLGEHAKRFANTPILTAYVGGKVGDGHNFRMKRDPKTGEEYASFTDASAERICGWFPDADKIRVENKDGVDWIVGTAKIWAYYNRELVDLLSVQGDEGMDISIETLVSDVRMDGDTEVFGTYEILGTTILGKGVNPAVEGAYIYRLSNVDERLNDFKLRVAAYQPKTQAAADDSGNKQKGERTIMSKKAIALMQQRFPNHQVLSVSDEGMTVLLLSKKGDGFFKYAFDANDNGVVLDGKFAPVNVTLNANMGEDNMISLDSEDAFDALNAAIVSEQTRANAAEEALEKANAAMKAMEDKENKRRVSAAKAAVKRELEEINQERGENAQIDEAVCAEVEKEIDNGTYTGCENADGEWVGDRMACDALKARCMDAVKKQDKQAAMNSRKVHAWSIDQGNPGKHAEGIDGAFARL